VRLDRAPIRLRLAGMYAGLLVAALGVVLAVSWSLLDRQLHRTLPELTADRLSSVLAGQFVLAIAGAALGTLGLGWLAAGRALSPLRRIATTARRISEQRLDARVQLDGPDDEIRELATAFDAMLDRVGGAVDAQRRFVANASHELRTPLTVMYTEAEVALDDAGADRAELRRVLGGLLGTMTDMESLLDALLELASATHGVRRREPVAIDAAVRRACAGVAPAARAAGSAIVLERCDAVSAPGDALLLERLVANLAENALRHGRRGGAVAVGLEAVPGSCAVLSVRNDGAVIPPSALARLTEPFERLDRTRSRGSGLGLSIVRAVAEAHGGGVELRAPATGGLEARVSLPLTVTGT
jgi:signal transduction histidine kinase